MVAGTASVNGADFDDTRSRVIVVHYDYTVLAGTQGRRNHYKQDRMFELAQRFRLPVVLFSEGGGGRPGDDNTGPRVAFDTDTFTTFSRLSGLVPLVGINNGRCFAGNTALLACCDVIIATKSSTIAMGGPAMIEGGGLGVYTPEEVGPMDFQVPNGVVDILVEDEDEAVDVAKRYLSYFQGPTDRWEEGGDQRMLRHAVPENRVRLYDMREIIRTLADRDSVLELREKFGIGIITCLIRIEGRPMGVIANNPHHLAGAVDSDGADKGARFLQLCDAFDIPVLSLMDCPGIMVGPRPRAHGAGPPLHAAVQHRGQPQRADVRRHRPQGLRAGRAGHVRGERAGELLHGGVADGGVRRHEYRGRGEAGLPAGPGGPRKRGRAQGRIRPPGYGRL